MSRLWEDKPTAVLGEPVPVPTPRHQMPRRPVFPRGWPDVRDFGVFLFFIALAFMVVALTFKLMRVI